MKTLLSLIVLFLLLGGCYNPHDGIYPPPWIITYKYPDGVTCQDGWCSYKYTDGNGKSHGFCEDENKYSIGDTIK